MTVWLWAAFGLLLCTLVVLDLVMLTRRPRIITPFEAVATMALWVMAAVGFAFVVGYVYETNWQNLEEMLSAPIQGQNLDGHTAWLQFLTCYILELALSLDNIAVLVLLYAFFRIPRAMLGRALFWSVLLSLVTRLGMITGGAALLRHWPQFRWVFGVILVLAMLRILVLPDERTNFDRSWFVRVVRRLIPVSTRHNGLSLFTHAEDHSGRPHWAITPMMLAVIVAALLDVTFAADSVPAMFSVTMDPFLAFSASAFAILGLRSLFFAVAGVLARFRYLKLSVVVVLLAVAAKIISANYHTDATLVTLGVVSGAMLLGVGLSVLRQNQLVHDDHAAAIAQTHPTPLEDLTDAVDTTRRNLRKIAILIAGTVVILFGIAIAPLPGPGPTILVPIGLAILATEFIWARRLLNTVKSGAFNISDKFDAFIDRTSVWLVPVVIIGYWVVALGLVYLGAFAIGSLIGRDITPRWYTVAIITGSPFMPLALWASSYLRKYFKRR